MDSQVTVNESTYLILVSDATSSVVTVDEVNDVVSVSDSESSITVESLDNVVEITEVVIRGSTNETASYAITASYALNGGGSPSISSSYALTASYALNGGTTLVTGSTYPITSSWAIQALTASLADTATLAANSLHANTADNAGFADSAYNATNADYASEAALAYNADSASYAVTASHALNAGTLLVTGSTYPITSSVSLEAVSSSYALTASYLLDSVKFSQLPTQSISSSGDYIPFISPSGSEWINFRANSNQFVLQGQVVTSSLSSSYALTSSFSANASSSSFASTSSNATTASYTPTVHCFGLTVDGGTTALTTGSKGYVTLPYSLTLTDWYLAADRTGNVVFDVRRNGISIIGSGNKPTLASQQFATASISSWNTSSLNTGDVIEFYLTSSATIHRVNLGIRGIS